uniref:Myb/SANT-like domain-containing protein n=1 Tax=Arundo donax TaxID=35708 RepID=A0A0A9B9P3_ARUDO
MPEAEWNDERTKIICELFVEQVRAGNRPNTHLNNIGYRQVASKFLQRTQLLYTKLQLKNKWDKLKSEYTTWNKLLALRAGLPWDSARGTIAADDEWWKKKNKELPGARKFRNGGLQNMDKLKVMFDYITTNGVDHSPLAANGFPSASESPMNGVDHSPLATQGLPSAPDSPMNSVDHSPLIADGLPSDSDPDSPMHGVDHLPLAADGLPPAPVSPLNGVNLDGLGNNTEHNGGTHPDHESFRPSTRNKRKSVHDKATWKNKKSKTETALLMQAHLDRILELAQKAQTTFEKFCSRPDPPSASSIQDVMTLVRECGARCGSNEHFIATELFVNREQREMFLTMETAEERFQWLRRKYIVKYLSSPSMGLR